MRYGPIPAKLFVENRRRLAAMMRPKSLAIVNNNDILPTNADGSLTLRPNSDLFYLSGVEQEVIALCDGCIEIPQFGMKHSLNISVAAGIVLWEVVRNSVTKNNK